MGFIEDLDSVRNVHVWFEIQINFDNYLQIYSWILDLNFFALSSCFGLLYCNLQVSSCDLKLSGVVMHSVHHQCQEQHSPFSHTPKIFFFFLNNQIKRKKWCIKCKLCIILVFQKRVYNIIYPRFSKIKYYLPMRKDSRMRFANMTWSVGLATPPDSETLVLIWIVLNRTEPNNTSIVAATVFVTSGPRPCFSRSSNFTTTLLTGVPNPSVKIRAASTATIVNRSWNISMNIIFVTRRGSLTWIKYKFAWVCYKQWWKRTCCWV